MACVPPAGPGFSPLDDELGLLPGQLTPTLQEGMARLGAWMPFEPGARMIGHFTHVDVSEPTVRRATERAGEAYEEIQQAASEALLKELPEAPAGPAVQQISVDGAMVPLVGGQWAEVKTLAIGTVKRRVVKGEQEVYTEELSYFSRMVDHESFQRLALVEIHRRGTEKAGEVAAVNDGADWEQGFVDYHRPDAVRILDWGHSAEHLSAAAQAVFGAGTAETSEWLGVQLKELKHGDPEKVLNGLRGLRDGLLTQEGCRRDNGALKAVTGSLEYLEKRRDQIRYAEFLAAGLPIGSGAVESGNKLVVESRLKGSGMHWARGHVNPMVALRNVVCSDRWDESWGEIAEQLRRQAQERADQRRAERAAAKAAALGPDLQPVAAVEPMETTPAVVAAAEPMPIGRLGKPADGHHRPAPDHPWRRMPIGRARTAA
jgi:hypothetical protein